MLSAIDTAMLASCAAEAEHEVSEMTLDVAGDMRFCQRINMAEELYNLAILLKIIDDRLI